MHVDCLTGTSTSAWNAAAARLEAEVPRLTDGQVTMGIAALAAMLHDDETTMLISTNASYPFLAQWVGGGLHLLAAPLADRAPAIRGPRAAAVTRNVPVGDLAGYGRWPHAPSSIVKSGGYLA